MILTPTVLILGAGASYPYRYPLGVHLVRRIIRITEPGGEMQRLLRGRRDIQELRERLRMSDVSSIDDFLESNHQFVDVGKQLIAAALTIFGPKSTRVRKKQRDWYRYLWTRLGAGAASLEDFSQNQLRIITYNYDQSLERYLTRVVVHKFEPFGQSPSKAAQVVKSAIPILHLHGAIRDGADDPSRTDEERDGLMSWSALQAISRDMSVVHEDRMQEAYETANNWFADAEAVHILGFGYHPTNLRRLDLKSKYGQGKWRAYGGSALGFERAERISIQKAIGLSGNPDAGIYETDCEQYLRAHAVLE